MAKRKPQGISPSGQRNPGREPIKQETLPQKTDKAKQGQILFPLIGMDRTVEKELAKTGLELLDGCQRVGVAMLPLFKAMDSFSKDMAGVAKSWNKILEPLFETARAFSKILGQWAVEWQKRTPQMLEFWEMTWPKIQPILEFYQAFEEMTPEKRKKVIENGWEIVRKKADREGLSSQEYRFFEVQVGRTEYSGEMEGLFYELLTLGGIFYEKDALCEFKTECIRLKYNVTPADMKRAREFNAVASMWEENASNRGIKALGEVLGTLGRIENDSIRTLECENWSGGTERTMAKRKTDETIPGGKSEREVPEFDSKLDKRQYATKEGGQFHALRIQKEERGIQLEREFWEFVEVSGLKFWGNLSSQQCERVLLQYDIPNLESMTPALLERCLGFWSPGGCGDWLSKVWFSGCYVLDTMKGNGGDFERSKRYPMYVENLLEGYFLHCDTEEEEGLEEPEEPQVTKGGLSPVAAFSDSSIKRRKEEENILYRLTITWAFVFDWWKEAVRKENTSGEVAERTERIEVQEVKTEVSEQTRPKKGQEYPEEKKAFLIGAKTENNTWNEVLDRFKKKFGHRPDVKTARNICYGKRTGKGKGK